MKINKIVIWGHELYDHTHSFIHNGFYIAFKELKYKTYWLNDTLNNSKLMDFENTLFITHGLVTKYLPICKNSIYFCHNTDMLTNKTNNTKIPKDYYNKNISFGIDSKNILIFQVYTKDCIQKSNKDIDNPYHYYFENTIYMPWATDLLPNQIDENIENLKNIITNNANKQLKLVFIGSQNKPWNKIKEICKYKNIKYVSGGGTFNKKSNFNKSVRENMLMIQDSTLSPAVQSEWQVEKGYIPCRIFKNISYGKMGMTNSETVNNLFNNKLIYSKDLNELINKGIAFEKEEKNMYKIIKELMIEVRDKHTYINRCNYMLNHINKYFKNVELIKIQ